MFKLEKKAIAMHCNLKVDIALVIQGCIFGQNLYCVCAETAILPSFL